LSSSRSPYALYTFFLSTYLVSIIFSSFFFFFNDPATTEIYTLSLHDALPILSIFRSGSQAAKIRFIGCRCGRVNSLSRKPTNRRDRKSTRLNSSHLVISYAVFCLKKKKKKKKANRHKDN